MLTKAGLLPEPSQATWLSLNGTTDLYSAISTRKHMWVCPKTRMSGMFRTYEQRPADDTLWNVFAIAAERAAAAAGFARRIAVQLAAAIGELEGNIYEHSQSPNSGILLFRAAPGTFEFVVADRGIGVLKSLRTCAEYSGVIDSGHALRVALMDGVSRFGADARRGYGFRPLFTGLANLNGALRFRSGDHALTIDGYNPTAIPSRVARKVPVDGLSVSVRCEVLKATDE
jgi:hypothetical protein